MVEFTDQELEEMAKSDAEIEREFARDWQEPSRSCASDLVLVSRLARRSRTTYGEFVAAHSQEEIQEIVKQMREGGSTHVSL